MIRENHSSNARKWFSAAFLFPPSLSRVYFFGSWEGERTEVRSFYYFSLSLSLSLTAFCFVPSPLTTPVPTSFFFPGALNSE